jgi:transposase
MGARQREAGREPGSRGSGSRWLGGSGRERDSHRRRVRGGHGSRGTVLLDVVVALFAASIAFGVTIGGIALAARTARVVRERLVELVALENEQAQARKSLYTAAEFRN